MIRLAPFLALTTLAGCASQNNPSSQSSNPMFTLEQINAAHAKMKSGADFPAYVQDVKALGIERYETGVSDGSTAYFGADGFALQGPAKYAAMLVANRGDKSALQRALAIHQAGKTTYAAFCEQAAEAGVEKWEVHTVKLTCTYFDKAGNVMLVENIPAPEPATN